MTKQRLIEIRAQLDGATLGRELADAYEALRCSVASMLACGHCKRAQGGCIRHLAEMACLLDYPEAGARARRRTRSR